MFKSIRILWIIFLITALLLLPGCDNSGGDCESGGGGSGGEVSEDDPNNPRTFIFSDNYPYDKKDNNIIRDKQPNSPHDFYIYLITNGGSWKDNDVKNIKVTYYDLSRGTTLTIPSSQIHESSYGRDDLTYIRVQSFSYSQNARGYFLIEAEVEQGNNQWYNKRVKSDPLFNYGTPPTTPPSTPLITKNDIIYEKEIVE